MFLFVRMILYKFGAKYFHWGKLLVGYLDVPAFQSGQDREGWPDTLLVHDIVLIVAR